MDFSTSVTIQPAASSSPSLPKTTSPPCEAESSHPPPVTHPLPIKVRLWRKIISVLKAIVVFISIGLGIATVVVLIPLGVIVCMSPFFVTVASMGAITMLTGNGILRAAYPTHYTSNASAAYIGVVGSLIPSVFMLCIPMTRDKEGNEKTPWYIQICACIIFSTLSGTIGSAVILHNHVDLGGIDILHATCAGALGGAILAVGSIPIAPLVFALVLLVFSPVWLAISMGAQRVSAKLSEDWKERNNWYSYCYCCGARDDPESDAGLANGPGR